MRKDECNPFAIHMVQSPDLETLEFKEIKGVKYFELYAEKVKREILPGLFINAYGFNGSMPGPTIVVKPGDQAVFRVHNQLEEPTGIHWHGLTDAHFGDGIFEVPEIAPGEYYEYAAKITNPPGTHFYQSNFLHPLQTMMGLGGGLIVEEPYYKSTADKDYFYIPGEFTVKRIWKGEITPGVYGIDLTADSGNFFTLNGRCYPFITPMEADFGNTVRIRLANFMRNTCSMHLHGHQFEVAARDGNNITSASRLQKSTAAILPGETMDIEFKAENRGVWPFHSCNPKAITNNLADGAGGMFSTLVYHTD